MFRWPILLTPLSLGGVGQPREALLEITPRGAAFTLAALTHVGHAAHLALVDAYLKGQMRLTPTAGIGEDSRTLVASLAAPLIAAAELGVERVTLADLILLPRDLAAGTGADQSEGGPPTRSVDCARFLLRGSDRWHWIRGAERFERAGCLGTRQVGAGTPWHDAVVELPRRPHADDWFGGDLALTRITAELRAATDRSTVSADLVHALRTLSLGRFARAAGPMQRAAERAVALLDEGLNAAAPLYSGDLRREWRTAERARPRRAGDSDPTGLAQMLSDATGRKASAEASLRWQDLDVEVALTPDPDGYQTLCLLPPADADPAAIRPIIRDMTRATIEALIGRPLAEHRSDPIVFTLRMEHGDQERVTTLDVGESIAIVRNQVVFTAWVGSDGRAMLKLFPPGGMSASPLVAQERNGPAIAES